MSPAPVLMAPPPVMLISTRELSAEPPTLIAPVPESVIEPLTLSTKKALAGPLSVSAALDRLMLPLTLTTFSPATPVTVVFEVTPV